MKCPLRSFRGKGTYDQDQSEDLDCLKEGCAWWDSDCEYCAIKGIEIGLAFINQNLHAIAVNIPKDLAPRG